MIGRADASPGRGEVHGSPTKRALDYTAQLSLRTGAIRVSRIGSSRTARDDFVDLVTISYDSASSLGGGPAPCEPVAVWSGRRARAEQAPPERGVRMWPEPDGMATLCAYRPGRPATPTSAPNADATTRSNKPPAGELPTTPTAAPPGPPPPATPTPPPTQTNPTLLTRYIAWRRPELHRRRAGAALFLAHHRYKPSGFPAEVDIRGPFRRLDPARVVSLADLWDHDIADRLERVR